MAHLDWLGWVPSPSLPYGRGTIDIVWSCLFTLFICTWTVQHPPVPAQGEKWYWVSLRKVRLMAITLLAPEFLVATSVGDYIHVIRKSMAEFSKTPLEEKWTATHAWFAAMGGFQVELTSPSGRIKYKRISGKGILALRKSCQIRPVTKSDIEDRSKADVLVKGTACIQSLWLVIQCCARAQQKLPITTLELATLGFVACTLVTYLAWLSRPQNVGLPITIISASDSNEIKDTIEKFWLEERDELPEDLNRISTQEYLIGFRSGNALYTHIAAILFGSIHLAGWNFNFPTGVEVILWRVASTTAATLSVALIPCYFLMDLWKTSSIPYHMAFFLLGLYVFARSYIIVALFITFRSQPPDVYQTVDWSKYFPHFA